MRFPILIATFTACLCAPGANAQEAQGKNDKQAAEAGMVMPKPGPEHHNLQLAEGTWNVTIETPGQPTTKGMSEFKMSMGGFWLVEKFTCDWNGMKFEGRSTTGYDPNKKMYVSTWIDNSSPGMTVTEGTYDPKTKTQTMTGDGYDMQGNKVMVKTKTIHKDANTVVFEMYHTGADKKDTKVMTITYQRQQSAKPPK
jgi:Protein of unknown function (DUF1579)